MGQRANRDFEEMKKIREVLEVFNEWNSKETEQDEWDENQDSEDDESDEEGDETTRNGFDMQDIRDVTAKLPTQKKGDGTIEGGQPEVIYTQAQIDNINSLMREQMMLREMQDKKNAESTIAEGTSKLKSEKKNRKDNVLTKTSTSSCGGRASKPRRKKTRIQSHQQKRKLNSQ